MNSDRIPIIFFINYSFFQKYLFIHQSISDNYLVKNTIQSRITTIQSRMITIWSKSALFSPSISKLIELFIILIIIYDKFKRCICKKNMVKYNVDWEVMLINDNFQIVWFQFFPEYQIFIYIWSNSKIFWFISIQIWLVQ
jgi:hypothetical protein